MFSNSFAIFPPLFFLLSAVNTGAAEPTLAAPPLHPRPRNPSKPDCSSACQLIALPDDSGQSLFSKLCGAAVPDESCTKFGQLETKVRVSGSGTQDILIKCLCSPNGNGVEVSRSEVSVEATTAYTPAEKLPSSSQPAQTFTPTTLGTPTDTILNDQSKVPSGIATTSNVKPDANVSLSPAASAGISVASLIAFVVLVGVCLSIWRRRLKRRENELNFESVWDGQQFPRNVPTLGEQFKWTR